MGAGRAHVKSKEPNAIYLISMHQSTHTNNEMLVNQARSTNHSFVLCSVYAF